MKKTRMIVNQMTAVEAAAQAVAKAPAGICPGCSMTWPECAEGGDSPERCLTRNFPGLEYEEAEALLRHAAPKPQEP